MRLTNFAILCPLFGGISPAIYFYIKGISNGGDTSNLLGAFTVWAFRDLLISYLFTLPILWICRRFGVTSIVGFWSVGAIVGAPMGFVLANPIQFAWTPTDQDFLISPYWHDMVIYMVLFGLTGFGYYFSSRTGTQISGTASDEAKI